MTTANPNSLPTLLDLMKLQDPNGAPAKVVDLLSKRSPLIASMGFKEGNLTTGHRVTSATALPSVVFRKLNQGVPASKGQHDQADEVCALIEGRSVVDCELARLNGNEAAYRMTQDQRFMSAMKIKAELSMFYASTKTAPEEFLGLTPRFDATAAIGGKQIVLGDAAPSGNDNTSLWGVVWGENSVYGIYPKGTKGGLEPEDMGKLEEVDANGNKFRAWVTYWAWRLGVCVEDFRQVTRIANVDVSQLTKTGATGTDLIDSIIQGYYKLEAPEAGNLVWYCNRLVAGFLHRQARAATSSSTLSIENIEGKPVVHLMGAPVAVSDAITNAEATVS